MASCPNCSSFNTWLMNFFESKHTHAKFLMKTYHKRNKRKLHLAEKRKINDFRARAF